MLEKIIWFIVYGIRGGVYGLILILLSTWFILISHWLSSAAEGSSLILMSSYIAQGIFWLGIGSFATGIIIWLVTWISDYRSDYLPNWIRREMY